METNKNTETKKQEAIRLAYEKLELPFNENILFDNGWTRIRPSQYYSKYSELDLMELTPYVHSIRPKSLSGIEDNNGWTSMLSEEDLPKETGYYWVKNKHSKDRIEVDYLDYNSQHTFDMWKEFNTHWQPIQKPNPPIF